MRMEPMVLPEQLRKEVTTMADRGEPNETLIAYMRSSGLPKPHSIRLLSIAAHIGLGEAKQIVHFSPTWADRRASDDAFHDSAEQAMEALQREEERNPERLAS